MSINIPNKFTKSEFKKLVDKKLNTNELQQYKNFFKDCYKRLKQSEEYVLEDDLSEEEKIKLDYVLKRIGYNNSFDNLQEIAQYFRMLLDDKKSIVLFAYNGTGKTRLSVEFKSLGKQLDKKLQEEKSDTLYYNAFTEDLFYWDNDLENDTERKLKLNNSSKFFAGLKELEMESKIRPLLHRYADFDFYIDYEKSTISFSRNILINGKNTTIDNIKISRGEENVFVWCFFLAIVQLVKDKEEAYSWVKYIYIDDPISSLDDNNVISIASHLAQLITENNNVKVVISSHHTLFFNVLCNEMNNPKQLFLQKDKANNEYILKDTTKTPFFHHVSLLRELKIVSDTGDLYTYHFNILRNILEKTSAFHGFSNFSACIRKTDDMDEIVHKRVIGILNHGAYSLFEPKEMVEENKDHFKKILNNFLQDYKFNENLFKDSKNKEEQ